MNKNKVAQCQGLFLIIDHGSVKGLRHWTDELERRGMPAVIQTNEQMLTEHGDTIRNLSARGFEICGAYNEKPFWNEPYRFQQEVMRRTACAKALKENGHSLLTELRLTREVLE